MQKNKINIAKKTLKELENISLKKISIKKILNGEKNIKFSNKNDLLININRYFDYLLKKNLINIENSSSKDMLFEVYMARLDILNLHRKSILNIIENLYTEPKLVITLLPSIVESIIVIATLSNIDVNGLKGVAKIKVLFILYLFIIFSWRGDESISLEKTMTTLDKYLNNIEKIFKFF
ncbi:hypothetical protein OAJ12_03175 [Pelagibacteraceae bacterium]|nr:hypothetical protein [Pelagibacteraceae bacterium]